MSSFIPSFHFETASKKLTREWCNEVINYYWHNYRLRYLLQDKKIEEIDSYAVGDYDLKPVKRIFRSLRKQMKAQGNANVPQATADNLDQTGLQWSCVPIIPAKLNAAISTAHKIPIEVTCTCLDPLATKKKKEDLEFLKARKKMTEAMQPLYDSMNLGEVDMGATRHSSVPFTALPMNMDVDNEDEFRIFANLIYNLAPESAFETVLQQFYDFKKASQIKLMEITDHYKYGISSNQCRRDKMTGLPNMSYIFPGDIRTDGGVLPDFSDRIITFVDMRVTPFELFNYFPDEIKSEDFLEEIVNFSGEKGNMNNGYCPCNNDSTQRIGTWDSYKMNLKYVEVRSVDKVMIAQKPKSKFKYLTDSNDNKNIVGNIWAQNVYCFYWLQNTKWFFGMDRLGFAHRSEGNETYQNSSVNIYRSQQKSAVELCIGENKKAQIADIKLQHTLIMSAPEGKIIDMKYMRNVIEGLTEEGEKYTESQLLDMAIEQNIHLIDTDGFEGKNTNQFVPVKELPGGLKDSILGYYRVMIEATNNISRYTSINDQLTGQSANPEGLIGLQKLLIDSSINSLRYINEAVTAQYGGVFNLWAYYIQEGIKEGGDVKKSIISMIGQDKVDIIKALNEVPLHRIGTKITLGQREEERAQFKMDVAKKRQDGVINAADEYFILNTPNPKDAMFLLAIAENRFIKRQDIARKEQLENNKQLMEQQGQNMMQNTQAKTQGDIQKVQAAGEVEAQLVQLAGQLGMNSEQVKGLIKLKLQQDRNFGQIDKSIKTIQAKTNAEEQKPIA